MRWSEALEHVNAPSDMVQRAREREMTENTRTTTDTLGHALATGVLRGHKGWVWCGSESVPAVTGGDADGCWPNDDGWFKSGCPGPHTPLYSGPHRSAEQPVPEGDR